MRYMRYTPTCDASVWVARSSPSSVSTRWVTSRGAGAESQSVVCMRFDTSQESRCACVLRGVGEGPDQQAVALHTYL